MSRAERRAQMEKAKRRAKKFGYMNKRGDDPRAIGLAAHTPKPCSCYCCGNPRKHFRSETIQERRSPSPESPR